MNVVLMTGWSVAEELRSLFLGQSLDLHWKYHVECPSVEQYMEMIDNSKSCISLEC